MFSILSVRREGVPHAGWSSSQRLSSPYRDLPPPALTPLDMFMFMLVHFEARTVHAGGRHSTEMPSCLPFSNGVGGKGIWFSCPIKDPPLIIERNH